MKKLFSIASALMLALSMIFTSCSNEIDEVVNKQPGLHKLHLTASAPQTPVTRSFVEGIENSDAIKITGWKDGDVIWGLYGVGEEVGFLPFTFSSTTNQFESEETSVTKEEIKYFITGNLDLDNIPWTSFMKDPLGNIADVSFYVPLKDAFINIDVEKNSCDIPMYGEARVAEGQLTTSMKMADGMAFVCLHNNSAESIDVSLVNKYDVSSSLAYIYGTQFLFEFNGQKLSYSMDSRVIENDPSVVAVTTIAAGEKAYLPVFIPPYSGSFLDIIVNGDYEHPFAEREESSFTPGKVYKLEYNGTAPAPTAEPLTFTALADGSTIKIGYAYLQYKTVNQDWTDYPANTDITLNADEQVQFKAKEGSTQNGVKQTFTMTGSFAASGSVMSLLGEGQEMGYAAFRRLFRYCTSLTTAPELPSMTLADECYYGMFEGCSNLTTAPALPATELKASCYRSMFQNCVKLVDAPELPATTLVNWCYGTMFNGCTSLQSMNVNFTEWNTGATNNWVGGVPFTGTFTCPASLPEQYGANYTQEGWTIVRK